MIRYFVTGTAALITGTALVSFSGSASQADMLEQFRAEMAVNAIAPRWMIDAENHHLTVLRMKAPTGNEFGWVCGGIISIGSPRVRGEFFQSYKSGLDLRDGEIVAMDVTTFFMPVNELLATDTCK
ncbi:hypothetical protein [Zhengella mangrovi]|nr:hypothetical protein [Zhengella mangrovi]